MRYRMMGATGIRVSEIGFGSGDNAGLLVKGEPEVQLRAIERALELGINYFDTSPDYGKGLAEENIGKAMREIGFRPVLATKVEIMPDELDHIADAVVESLEDSLRRLQVDHVDVLQIHHPPSIETDTTVPGWLHL
ncbi:MAG: aldo/keto reductase, partial [Chloroflexi bacterium]|nr:aldo/keto reductase [Chloroflexota bacterium]